MRLRELTAYRDIVVQCHNNPDADALASGFAVLKYLEREGKTARFVYGGFSEVQKSNLLLMMENLHIPAEYVKELEKPELLVMVDCQYGESNAMRFEAEHVAVIDHHQVSSQLPELNEVHSNYGSCATVLFEMLQAEGFDINEDEDLATALYYGLMTDTGNFSEISHPADKDLRDAAHFRPFDILCFKNSNLSREELLIAGDALKKAKFNEEWRFGMIAAKPCDPNLLGLISDMLLEVNGVDCALVYNLLAGGVKTSVRSCIREVRAGELAQYLAEGYGGGGGHLGKAGGFLIRDLLEQGGIRYTEEQVEAFFEERLIAYHRESEIIHAGVKEEDPSLYRHYVKKELHLGYVEAGKLASPGSTILIRTLEGDVDVKVEEDLYIILGVEGEVYPCKKAKFENSYRLDDTPYVYPGDYAPAVVSSESGDRVELLPFAKSCIAKGGAGIYARQIDHRVKVFTTWDPEKYYLGVPGDYMAVRTDDLTDIYIIAGRIFDQTYTEA